MVGYVGRRGSYRFIYQKCLDTYVDVADSYIKTMVGYVGERGRRVWESYKCGSDLPHNWFSLTPFPRFGLLQNNNRIKIIWNSYKNPINVNQTYSTISSICFLLNKNHNLAHAFFQSMNNLHKQVSWEWLQHGPCSDSSLFEGILIIGGKKNNGWKIFAEHSCSKCGHYLHLQYPKRRKFSHETDIGRGERWFFLTTLSMEIWERKELKDIFLFLHSNLETVSKPPITVCS